VSDETALDLRRRRITRRIRFDMVLREWSESDESESLEELLSELEESSQLAAGPGVASSSMMCWGVDSYRYECEISWKSKYTMYTNKRIYFKSAFRPPMIMVFRERVTHHAGSAADLEGLLIGKGIVTE
jgi:hypothetical protein